MTIEQFVVEQLIGKTDPIFNKIIDKARAQYIVASLMGKKLGDTVEYVKLSDTKLPGKWISSTKSSPDTNGSVTKASPSVDNTSNPSK